MSWVGSNLLVFGVVAAFCRPKSVSSQLMENTWFKVPLEITKSDSGADQLIDVSKYLEDTRTVKFDLSRPLFLA